MPKPIVKRNHTSSAKECFAAVLHPRSPNRNTRVLVIINQLSAPKTIELHSHILCRKIEAQKSLPSQVVNVAPIAIIIVNIWKCLRYCQKLGMTPTGASVTSTFSVNPASNKKTPVKRIAFCQGARWISISAVIVGTYARSGNF